MTAVVAWLALAVSLGSIAWQVISWVRSGSRVRIQLVDARPAEPESSLEEGIALVATNVGRLAATVYEIRLELAYETKVSMRDSQQRMLVLAAAARDVTLPVKLDPGEETQTVWDADEVDLLLGYARNGRRDLVGRVRVATGTITTRGVRGYRIHQG
jgi:hypothetical protein